MGVRNVMFGFPDMRGMMGAGPMSGWWVAGSILWLVWVAAAFGLGVWAAVSLAGIRRELAGLAQHLADIGQALREREGGQPPR